MADPLDRLNQEGQEDPANAKMGTQEPPAFKTMQHRPRILADLFRVLLILLSLIVAAGFILILMSQPAVDKMAQDLQSRHTSSRQEQIALLYLGDEVQDNKFHIRGHARNITADPIQQLDVAIRFYSHDGNLLETALIRMNKDTIAPDEVAQFDLVIPNYQMQFASYAVEFKWRRGGIVPYKDMRAARTPQASKP
jgi:hypothetical protein